MTFNSWQFLIFLPVVVFLYYIFPHKFRWLVLLIASYYAYMSWNPWLVFLILATTIVSYVSGLLMNKVQKQWLKKLLLAVTIIVCLGILIYFKYFNFLLSSIISFLNLFSMNLHSVSLDIILPIGISFYTFQTLSYVIDVYRGKFEPEKHFGYFALFVSFFPQLVAGPIERPEKLLPQFKEKHTFNKEDFICGLQLLATGFFRKCVVADLAGVFVNHVYGDLANATSLAMLVSGALFMLQLYCDFGGYSEIAAGAARLMGIKLSINFYKPFKEPSIQKSMRYWHMTLTSWFTDYVYIPLGGNRKGKARQIINVFIVYMLCGLWHGANWTFVLWGLFIATIMSIENAFKKPIRKFAADHNINYHKPWINMIRRIFIFLLLVLSTFFFRAQSISDIGLIYHQLFTKVGFGHEYFTSTLASLNMNVLDIIEIALVLVVMLKLYDLAYDKPLMDINVEQNNERMIAKKTYAKTLILSLMVLTIALGWFMLISSDATSAFVYFQF